MSHFMKHTHYSRTCHMHANCRCCCWLLIEILSTHSAHNLQKLLTKKQNDGEKLTSRAQIFSSMNVWRPLLQSAKKNSRLFRDIIFATLQVFRICFITISRLFSEWSGQKIVSLLDYIINIIEWCLSSIKINSIESTH